MVNVRHTARVGMYEGVYGANRSEYAWREKVTPTRQWYAPADGQVYARHRPTVTATESALSTANVPAFG